eukprot:scaffold426_cov319-Pavlova_lutheri.AAC.19
MGVEKAVEVQEMVRDAGRTRGMPVDDKAAGESSHPAGWWWSGAEWWSKKFSKLRVSEPKEDRRAKEKPQHTEDDWTVDSTKKKEAGQAHRHTQSESQIEHVQLQIEENEIEPPSIYTTLKDDRRLLEESNRKIAYLEQRNDELSQRVEGLQEALYVERAQKIKAQRTLEHMDNMLADAQAHKNKLVRTNERLQYDNFQLGALQMKYDQSKASVRELLRKVDELQDEKRYLIQERLGSGRRAGCSQCGTSCGELAATMEETWKRDVLDYNQPDAFPGADRADGLPVVSLSRLRT